MKIEVGKSYINATGEVTTILDVRPMHLYPFICKSYSYTKDGYRIQNMITSEDLICEVVPEIYEAYTLGYILSQREFMERHIKHWTDSESAWVSARRNIRANRLEALAHSIGGAYEFEFRKDNYYIYVREDGTFAACISSYYLEPEKIYMTKETAEQVCEILNSGSYKLNIDVEVEDDAFCEEYCCDACAGNDC